MSASVFFLILAILVCTFVVVQVRHQRMKERYAALWLIIGAIIIVLGAFPNLLNFTERESVGTFYKKRFTKILVPLLIWGQIYLFARSWCQRVRRFWLYCWHRAPWA